MNKQPQKKPDTTTFTKPSGFWRYIAAVSYDLLLVIALFFPATAILLPFNNGEAIHSPLYSVYLLAISFIFYGWFWTHGGQTLGLQAWKLRLISNTSCTDITWPQALTRYISAIISWLCLGLGIIWCFWQKDRKTWQDLASKTQLIQINKSQKH